MNGGKDEPSEKTYECRVLDRHPAVRATALASTEFAEWREQLPSLVVDGVRYYVRGGDMLRDEDQIVFEWALRSNLLTQQMVEDAGTEGAGTGR